MHSSKLSSRFAYSVTFSILGNKTNRDAQRHISIYSRLTLSSGDLLSKEQLNTALPIFLDRLRNEITRLTTVKSLSLIAHSPLHIQLDQILGKFVLLGAWIAYSVTPL